MLHRLHCGNKFFYLSQIHFCNKWKSYRQVSGEVALVSKLNYNLPSLVEKLALH